MGRKIAVLLLTGFTLLSFAPGVYEVYKGKVHNPYVAGLLVNVSWRKIERERGKYFWGKIDRAIEEARKNGIGVVLNVFAGGANVPDYLLSDPAVKTLEILDTNPYHRTHCQRLKVAAQWDKKVLHAKLRLIEKLGERYGSNPTVVGVMVSFANTYTNEWHMPYRKGKFCGEEIDQVAQWREAGYSSEKLLEVGKLTLDAWARAFPNALLKLPIAPHYLDEDPTALPAAIVSYGVKKYGERFAVQVNALSADFPEADEVDELREPVNGILKLLLKAKVRGLQMLAAASQCEGEAPCRMAKRYPHTGPSDVLRRAVEVGLTYGITYLEVWWEDGENPGLFPTFRWASEELRSRAEPKSDQRR